MTRRTFFSSLAAIAAGAFGWKPKPKPIGAIGIWEIRSYAEIAATHTGFHEGIRWVYPSVPCSLTHASFHRFTPAEFAKLHEEEAKREAIAI